MNYIQPTKFISFEFSARKWGQKWGEGDKLEMRLDSGEGPEESHPDSRAWVGGRGRRIPPFLGLEGPVYKYPAEESGKGLV